MNDETRFQVSLQRLVQLLGEEAEASHLDFKATLDLDKTRDAVELARDVAAFSAEGGHIVVGIDDNRRPFKGFSATLAKKFDDANLRQKLEKYLAPPVCVRSGLLDHDGQSVVLIRIDPCPDGVAVIRCEGTYKQDDGSPRVVFREGDVFVRDGTRTKRWGQHDVRAFVARTVERKKDEWLEARREELLKIVTRSETVRLADGPASALSWSLDATTFEDLVVELLRDDDQVPARLLVESAVPVADQGLRTGDSGSAADYVSLIDKLTVIAGIGIRLGHDASRNIAISALVAIYEHVVGLVSPVPVENLARPPAVCWLDIGLRITLLGGLAVRRQSWSSVRCLALQRVPDARDDTPHYWLRHALTEASRARLMGGGRFDERSARPWIPQAFEVAGGLPSLTRDLPRGSSRLVDSLYQFDLMAAACVIAETNSTDLENWYPNFASASRLQLEPAVMRLLTDSVARKAIFPLDDDDLAVLLRDLAKAASENAPMWSMWEGWRRKEIAEFLDRHPPRSE